MSGFTSFEFLECWPLRYLHFECDLLGKISFPNDNYQNSVGCLFLPVSVLIVIYYVPMIVFLVC